MISILTLAIFFISHPFQAMFTHEKIKRNTIINKPRNFPGDIDLALISQIKRTQTWIDEEQTRYNTFAAKLSAIHRPSSCTLEQLESSYDYLHDLIATQDRMYRIYNQNFNINKKDCRQDDFIEEKYEKLTSIIPSWVAKELKKRAKKDRLAQEKKERIKQQENLKLPSSINISTRPVQDQTHALRSQQDIKFCRSMVYEIVDDSIIKAHKRLVRKKTLSHKQTRPTLSSSTVSDDGTWEDALKEQQAFNAAIPLTQIPSFDPVKEYQKIFDEIADEEITWHGLRSQIYIKELNHLAKQCKIKKYKPIQLLQKNPTLYEKYKAALSLTIEVAGLHRQQSMSNPEVILNGLLGEKSYHDHLEEVLQELGHRKKI